MDLLLTGRLVDAEEAMRRGLVNRIVPAAGLMAWALETAEVIAANSPSAVQAVKQQISATIAEHARSREALDQELGDRVRASADSPRVSPRSGRSARRATSDDASRTPPSAPDVRVERDERVLTLTLDRPGDQNRLTRDVLLTHAGHRRRPRR